MGLKFKILSTLSRLAGKLTVLCATLHVYLLYKTYENIHNSIPVLKEEGKNNETAKIYPIKR